MKRTFIFGLFALAALFSACNNRVDLYADYKEIPVIYGLLDYQKDTNFIRINRAFCGSNDNPINANEVALIADSNNYPGKLNARIVELKRVQGQYTGTGRIFDLDTLTVHNKQEGTFYSPDQKLYYTTAQLRPNTDNNQYRYRLEIFIDNDTVSSETGLVGGEDFRITTANVTFSPVDNGRSGKLSFIPADNASFYEMSLRFTYKEIRGNDTITKEVHHSFGTMSLNTLTYENGTYMLTYPETLLFNLLDNAIGNDINGVVRNIGVCTLTLVGGGDELYNFVLVNNNGGGYSQTVPDYTNVKGGYGVFSSRLTITRDVALSRPTLTSLYGMPWGFVQN